MRSDRSPCLWVKLIGIMFAVSELRGTHDTLNPSAQCEAPCTYAHSAPVIILAWRLRTTRVSTFLPTSSIPLSVMQNICHVSQFQMRTMKNYGLFKNGLSMKRQPMPNWFSNRERSRHGAGMRYEHQRGHIKHQAAQHVRRDWGSSRSNASTIRHGQKREKRAHSPHPVSNRHANLINNDSTW